MKTLKDVLSVKGSIVYSVRPDHSAFDVMREMSERGIGAVLVMEGDQLSGIVSERDVARKVTLEEKPAREAKAREIMTSRVTCGRLDLTIEQGMAIMTEKRVRHLPVIDQGKVVGMISIGDLVKTIIDEQRFVISQLEMYICS